MKKCVNLNKMEQIGSIGFKIRRINRKAEQSCRNNNSLL